ncbi:Protein of unknown function (DUF2948) [Rhodovulum imhoffii]|uniref:DUF2948 family protein n=1 Tax=Rhodovulum imhoffii TaxID=365340 RepID=A0A2T5BQX1_9RHOB|nr:DUF2948 family protein [Rhodovulum imhoffii]MBK5932599.1 hypothetical protein [Rhodovulum imhoffii]PTN01619.1 Protein of unknown function (DUF2948) [Rhodovulum imhoffii]
MADARFEDGGEKPLSLMATDREGLEVVSALVQDAVFPVAEMTWDRTARRFALLLNRFRWEDHEKAERVGRPFERVRTLLVFGDVMKVASQGFTRGQGDLVLSLLSVTFTPGEDGTGRVDLTLAGDGAIALDVECLDATLRDVTRPYIAPSGKAPRHGQ